MKLWWIQLLCLTHYTVNGYFKGLVGNAKCKDEDEPWSYRGKNGPKTWGERYTTCKGQEQSPIDIKTKHAIFNSALKKLAMKNYDVPVTKATIENNGHSIQVTPLDGVERSIFINSDTYKLAQFHFHWGSTPERGAEHTVNGMQYSMELHFVHLNAKRETAVVGVFFQEHARITSSELQKIISEFPKVMYKHTRTVLNAPINLNHLLPANPSSYFRYKGSLTTPNCAEGITWSVLLSVLPVGKDQMKEFRQLYSVNKAGAGKKCKLTDNYRPVQSLNKRKVYRSR